MEDLIARIYPFEQNKNAIETIEDPINNSRHFEALRKKPKVVRNRADRETTAAPEDDKDTTYDNGLQLTFTHEPKAGLGFVIGCEASSCDIVVGRLIGISRRHCYITFDAQRRLIVRDCSSYGTIVTYDKKGGKKRRNFTWIIGGDKFADETKKIVIQIHDKLKFQILVFKPIFPDLFFTSIDRFRAQVTETDKLPFFGGLDLESGNITAAATGAQTPKQDSILLRRKKLGEGAFSVVYHVWDASTGHEFALKDFKMARQNKPSDWRKEAAVLEKTSHVCY
jgi:hypothetical protein